MKKLNKFFAVLVALAMMATLCVMNAFAADGDEPATTAPITKTLTIPADTAIPATATAHFKFDLTNAPATATDAANLLKEKSLDMKAEAENAEKTSPANTNTDVYKYTVDDVLSGITWPVAGYYEWTVEEDVYNADDGLNETTDHKGKDNSKYKMVVKVVYDENGTLVPGEVIIKKGTDGDSGTTYDNAHIADGLAFANTYYATTGNPGEKPNPEDPDKPLPDPDKPGDEDDDAAGLSVTKIVTGDFGDKSKNGKFEIKIKLDLPQIGDAANPKAFIRRADAEATPEAVTFVDGEATVKLSHNDKIFFTEIANGTTYTIEETDDRVNTTIEGYEVEYSHETGVIQKDAQAETVTNKSRKDETPPTGILISNLPYIALALVAIGGLVAYVVVRRRDEDNA